MRMVTRQDGGEKVRKDKKKRKGGKNGSKALVIEEGKPGVAAHICNPSTQEGETEGSPQVRGQPGLHGEFKTSLNYIVRFMSQKIRIRGSREERNGEKKKSRYIMYRYKFLTMNVTIMYI